MFLKVNSVQKFIYLHLKDPLIFFKKINFQEYI